MLRIKPSHRGCLARVLRWSIDCTCGDALTIARWLTMSPPLLSCGHSIPRKSNGQSCSFDNTCKSRHCKYGTAQPPLSCPAYQLDVCAKRLRPGLEPGCAAADHCSDMVATPGVPHLGLVLGARGTVIAPEASLSATTDSPAGAGTASPANVRRALKSCFPNDGG